MEAAFVRCLSQLTVRSPGCLRVAPSSTKRISHRATSKTQLRSNINSHSRTLTTALVLRQDEGTTDGSLSSKLPQRKRPSRATATTSPAQGTPQVTQPQRRKSGNDVTGAIPPTSTAPSPTAPSKPLSRDEEIAKQMDSLFARHASKTNAANMTAPNRPRSNYDYYGGSSSGAPNPLFSRSSNTDPHSFLSPASSSGAPSADLTRNAALNSLLTSQFYLNSPAKRDAPLRLKPTLGKTVEISEDKNFGLSRAFPTLEAKINRGGNSVKMDMFTQRFHVRRGMQKKVYKRIRGREMFMQGFLGECARLRRMIKQGW